LADPSFFTEPYDRALMGGLRSVGDEVRLYACATAQGGLSGGLSGRDPNVVQHFYPLLTKPPFSRMPRALARWYKGIDHPVSMGRLAAALRAWQPDVIHFQWTPLPVADRWFLPGLRRIAPIVCTVHDVKPYNGDPTSWIQDIGASAILRRFDAVIVHTEQARLRLESRMNIGIVRRIPHGLLHGGEAGAEMPRHAAVPDSPVLKILSFGKIKPYKGLDILIRALSLLAPAERSRCRVSLVGEPYMDTGILKGLAATLGIADLVEFDFRFVADREVERLFAEASVVVLPYREVSASGVLMTAVAAGCPVIATSVGGFSEILTDGTDALLVPPDDPPALCAALSRLIQDGALRERLSAGIRKLRASTADWVEIGHATHALYEEAIAARRAGS
jgi:glycosyltransferase involved in cell wall biosynthesis